MGHRLEGEAQGRQAHDDSCKTVPCEFCRTKPGILLLNTTSHFSCSFLVLLSGIFFRTFGHKVHKTVFVLPSTPTPPPRVCSGVLASILISSPPYKVP